MRSDDLILVAEIGKEIAGVVRICNGENFKVLRGMQVLPKFRGKGVVGPALLDECGQRIAATCYCIPYAHLVGFYGKIMFRKISEKEAPAPLRQRIAELRKKHGGAKSYIIMRRPANFI